MKNIFKRNKSPESAEPPIRTSADVMFEELTRAGIKPERGVNYVDLSSGLPNTLGHLAMTEEARNEFLAELEPALEQLGFK